MAGATRRTIVVGATGGMESALALERARQGDILALIGRASLSWLKLSRYIGRERGTWQA